MQYDAVKLKSLGFDVDLVTERAGREDIFDLIIPNFISDLNDRIKKIKKCLKNCEFAECKAHFHSLVGSAATAGHRELYEKTVCLDNFLAMEEIDAFKKEVEQYFEYCSDLLSKL